MADNRTFTLIGKFDDQISKKLREVNKLFADIRKSTESFSSEVGSASKSINKMTSALEDAGRAAGKVRDTVSQIGEGVKGLDGISESLESAARAAGRAQDEVLGIGEAAGRANRQADDLMNTLLKAEGLSKFGDAMAQGFNRGMNVVMGTIQKAAGLTAKLFKDAMDDELADIKAAQGIEGSFGLAGFKGDFKESQRMYKKYDQVVSEMIRQSSAPTSKVVELQRYTLDTIGPLMLAAQGVKKGTAMKDIDPKKIQDSAKQYGSFLEKAALFSQGTGSNTVRVAAGLEQLVTRGKIDTTIDFFSDNIMLMKNLEAVGFMGRRGGGGSGKMMNATDAQRMAAMMEAFNKSMSGESTKAMANSLTGSLQGLQDTIFNPSVGILGMSVTFSKEEQKKANESIRRIQNERIAGYRKELKNVSLSEKRKEELRINIKQAETTRDQLISEDEISTPFKAFSYAFSNLIRNLTAAINAIGPVWTSFAVAAIEVTNKVFGPLGETLGNVASDMRAKKVTQAEGFGRIVGEIFKTIGQIMGDLANMINDPNSAMGKVQSEFMKGFMAAFKAPGTLQAAQEGIKNGLSALIGKFFEFLWKAITFEPIRPLMLLFVAGIFGPPLIGAVIAGATPLIISAIGRMVVGSLGRGGGGAGGAAAGLGAFITPGGARAARGIRGAAGFGGGLLGLAYSLGGRPGLKAGRGLANALGGIGGAAGKVGRFVPGGALAFGALDAGVRMASGQDAGKAIGGAAAATIGSVLGGILGQALIPVPGVGAAVGGIAGGIIGDKVGNFLMQPSADQRQAAQMQLQAGLKQLDAAGKASQEKYGEFGPKLGGVEALNRALGGGAGVKNYAVEQLKLGKILPQQAREWSALGSELSTLNNKTEAVNKAQAAYNVAKAASTGEEKKAASNLSKAKSEQLSALRTISQNWESMSSASRVKILQASDEIAAALNAGAARIKGVSVTNAPGRPVGLPTRNWKELLPPPAPGTRRIYNGRYSYTDVPADPKSGNNEPGGEGWPLSHFSTKNWGEGCSVGSLGGSQAGSVDAFNSVARGKGLSLTSGYRPGSRGFHGINRARDYSNGYSPTPQMLSFATHMAQTYGANLRELIYTPLGFSIKNGRKVPPYATDGHYNHVHVAYALGAGMPAFFSSQRAAMDWERKATLGNVKVSSITSNSSEGMGGAVSVNAPITIYQQPGQNSEQLAALVAMEFSNAINQARSSSMYV
jgi:hypothetical protein